MQTAFLDLGTPKASDNKDIESDAPADDVETADEATLRGSVYADIRAKLIKAGVPADQIAFVHDAKDATAKANLSAAMNDGRIRIVLGSTAKMGTGMNAQKRMIALHHLDCPWRPCDLDQREGRIVRAGNTNKNVHIYSYATEGEVAPGENESAMSFDTYMWQTVEHKARAINSIIGGKGDVRRTEDTDMVLTAAQMKALSTGDPRIMKQVSLQQDVRQLEALERAHERERTRASVAKGSWPRQREELDRDATAYETAASHAAAHRPQKGWSVTIGNSRYDEAGDGGDQILHYARSLKDGEARRIGHFQGLTLEVKKDPKMVPVVRLARDPNAADKGDDIWLTVPLSESGRGMAQRLSNAVGHLDELVKEKREAIARGDADMAQYAQAAVPFPKRDLLLAKRNELKALNRDLGIDKDENVDGGDDSEEIVEKAVRHAVPEGQLRLDMEPTRKGGFPYRSWRAGGDRAIPIHFDKVHPGSRSFEEYASTHGAMARSLPPCQYGLRQPSVRIETDREGVKGGYALVRS